MHIFHLSAECYPAAKVGGLGDVLGALPKYLISAGVKATVVMPYYEKPFVINHPFEKAFEGSFTLREEHISFKILKEASGSLGFDLYLVYIPGLLDRPEVYSYPDEHVQFIAFQIAFLEWILKQTERPSILHCHDHHTGLIPFLVNNAYRYSALKKTPTVFTIHNAQYQGIIGWENADYLPQFDPWKAGLLDWDGRINPLAAAVKSCWKYTTVSPGYMNELPVNNSGLQELFRMEHKKGRGILNGIDTEIWNPSDDKYLIQPYSANTVENGKDANKERLCHEFNLDAKKPLISFIGRLAGEKGADLLPAIITDALETSSLDVNFLILGSGDYFIENSLAELKQRYPAQCAVYIGYNEELSHRVYAGTDFLIMPSRVEPCGLNQLYSLKYGTMPLVSRVGGLNDTVVDFDEFEDGYGICFDTATVPQASQAIRRAIKLFGDTVKLNGFRKQMMALDFSWQHAAQQYIDLYNTLKPV